MRKKGSGAAAGRSGSGRFRGINGKTHDTAGRYENLHGAGLSLSPNEGGPFLPVSRPCVVGLPDFCCVEIASEPQPAAIRTAGAITGNRSSPRGSETPSRSTCAEFRCISHTELRYASYPANPRANLAEDGAVAHTGGWLVAHVGLRYANHTDGGSGPQAACRLAARVSIRIRETVPRFRARPFAHAARKRGSLGKGIAPFAQ